MQYNPAVAPESAAWLGTDEEERLYAIQCWVSDLTGTGIEDCVLEAVPILAVENQVAGNDPPVTRATLERLLEAGIDRMTAIQVMSDVMYDALSRTVAQELQYDEDAYARALIERYRERLFSISWFMRCLNEPIARQANAEDNVTGRFWEGRFKSQALLDEAAVVAAMAYVDLNPIRAAMADTPEESDYTSIQQRVLEQDPKIAARDPERIEALPEDLRTAIGRLMPFSDQAPNNPEHAIPYQIQDDLELVDWSGRAIIEGKRGKIPDDLPPILERLEIDPHNYLRFINRTQKSRFHGFIGSVKSMRGLAADFGRSFLKGQAAAAALFSSG